MTQTILEQRQEAAEALRLADHQRATDYLALVTSEPAVELLAAAQALYDPAEPVPAGAGNSINKLIGYLVTVLGGAEQAAQVQLQQLTAPATPPVNPPVVVP